MIDSKTIVGGAAMLVGIAIGIGVGYKVHTVPEPNLQSIKRSIEERFHQAYDSKLHKDVKDEIFKRVLENAKKDIRELYAEEFHQQLFAYTDEQYKYYYDLK